jgi:hypothetical protein
LVLSLLTPVYIWVLWYWLDGRFEGLCVLLCDVVVTGGWLTFVVFGFQDVLEQGAGRAEKDAKPFSDLRYKAGCIRISLLVLLVVALLSTPFWQLASFVNAYVRARKVRDDTYPMANLANKTYARCNCLKGDACSDLE